MIDTLIIGGGATGLYAASLLPNATILERNAECGKKLLLTGGGRSNYTHTGSVEELIEAFNGNKMFIKRVLYQYSNTAIIEHLEALGIFPSDENGKIFPWKKDARDLRDALAAKAKRIINAKADAIRAEDGIFIIETREGEIDARRVIIAAGGNAYPQTGSDGSSYTLAKSLGHKVVPPRPALAAIMLEPSLQDAEGISLPLTLKRGRIEKEGMAVITKQGISGPVAENFSRSLEGKEEIEIAFSHEEIKKEGNALLKNALSIPPRLASCLLGDLAEKRIQNLSKSDIKKANALITKHSFMAKPIARSAMSTAGGISTDEINPMTMESKLVPNLFFAGDAIDVDAACGGYSLTWAFATAAIAAEAIKTC